MNRSLTRPGIEYHPLYFSDLEEAVIWLESKAELGGDLVECVEEAVSRIRRNPLAFRIDRKMDARRCLVRRFPYVLYFDYDRALNRVFVYVLAHASRKPAFWKERMNQD